MKIAIIGPGGIGCLFSALLAEAGHDVCLIDRRPDRAALIAREGMIIESESPPAPCLLDLRNSAEANPVLAKVSNGNLRGVTLRAFAYPVDIGPVELIILCVKSHETAGTIPSVRALSDPGTSVLSLQNGLGNLEVIERIVKSSNLFAGITTMGATVIGLNHIRHAGIGLTFVGPLGDNHDGAEKLTKTLSKAGIEAAATQDTMGMLWSKLVINAAICPVSVLANLPNGGLVKNEKWRALLDKAAEEAGAVATAKGIKLLFDDPVKAVREVCEKTASNISSMLQDIRRGRQTEIMEINGAVLRTAAGLGIDAPTNAMLCQSVVDLEKRAELNCRQKNSEPIN